MTNEEAVKMLRTMLRTVYLGNRKFEDAIECAIKALSEPLQPWEVLAAQAVLSQPEPHWIPVTKDTPKEAGTYMCTCYDAGRRIVTLVKWQPRTKTWNLIGARAYWKVIAWCKRPEPYKGVTE